MSEDGHIDVWATNPAPGDWRPSAFSFLDWNNKSAFVQILLDMHENPLPGNPRDERDLALLKCKEAFESLFAQCSSNPVYNQWGKVVDCMKFNEAKLAVEEALKETK